jgi:dipeptidyl aminopeptidase/acylaminoacyl peptidase
VGPADWALDGKTLLVGEYVSINESYLWLFDVKTGERIEFTPRNAGPEKVAYDDAGSRVMGRRSTRRPTRTVSSAGSRTSTARRKEHAYLTTHIPWDVESFELSDDGKRIALVTNEDGISRLRLMDTATRKEHAVEGLAVGVIGGLEWHKNNRD